MPTGRTRRGDSKAGGAGDPNHTRRSRDSWVIVYARCSGDPSDAGQTGETAGETLLGLEVLLRSLDFDDILEGFAEAATMPVVVRRSTRLLLLLMLLMLLRLRLLLLLMTRMTMMVVVVPRWWGIAWQFLLFLVVVVVVLALAP